MPGLLLWPLDLLAGPMAGVAVMCLPWLWLVVILLLEARRLKALDATAAELCVLLLRTCAGSHAMRS